MERVGNVTESLRVELSYPANELSPNSRAHHMVVARFKKAARIEANWATRIAPGFLNFGADAPIPIKLVFHPKPTGPRMDADNAIASAKASLDGVAEALGINDRDFNAPTVEWAERCRNGKLTVVVG